MCPAETFWANAQKNSDVRPLGGNMGKQVGASSGLLFLLATVPCRMTMCHGVRPHKAHSPQTLHCDLPLCRHSQT